MIYEPEEGGEVIFLTREDGEMNGWNASVLGIVENRGYADRVLLYDIYSRIFFSFKILSTYLRIFYSINLKLI